MGLVGADLHLIDGTNSSALVHGPIDEDVFLGPDNGNGVTVMDGQSLHSSHILTYASFGL